jgi:ketosteroid isomerase-like protein
MSRENVDIARRAWEAGTRSPPDWVALDALYDPDHVLQSDWGVIEAKAYRGADGFLRYLADMDEAFSEWRHEFVDANEAGPAQVVVSLRLVAKGRLSESPVEQRFAVLLTLRNGRIISTTTFIDEHAAHAASDAS